MGSTQLVLGLDLDGVCFDYERAARERFADLLGVDATQLGPQTHWSLVDSGWPLRDEAHFAALHTASVRAGLFADMPVIDGASKGLWALSNAGVYIRVVTHRLGFKGVHARAATDTVLALDAANLPYRDLTFVADKPAVGAHVYLDDAPHNIEHLRAAGKYAIVMDQLYNRHLDGPRAHTWDDVVTLVRAYALANDFTWDEPDTLALAS